MLAWMHVSAGRPRKEVEECMHAWVHIGKHREGIGGCMLVYTCREVQGRRALVGMSEQRGKEGVVHASE